MSSGAGGLVLALGCERVCAYAILNLQIRRQMTFLIETEQETDGRWIAEVAELPGVLAYGRTVDEAKAKVQALALRVVADRLEHGEAGADLLNISFAAA